MKRRSFLAGLLALPLAKHLPTPKLPEPTPRLEPWQDQTSIWICSWGDGRVYAAADRPVHAKDGIYYMGAPVITNRNWLKRELNK